VNNLTVSEKIDPHKKDGLGLKLTKGHVFAIIYIVGFPILMAFFEDNKHVYTVCSQSLLQFLRKWTLKKKVNRRECHDIRNLLFFLRKMELYNYIITIQYTYAKGKHAISTIFMFLEKLRFL
jgi:hypothetical protein